MAAKNPRISITHEKGKLCRASNDMVQAHLGLGWIKHVEPSNNAAIANHRLASRTGKEILSDPLVAHVGAKRVMLRFGSISRNWQGGEGRGVLKHRGDDVDQTILEDIDGDDVFQLQLFQPASASNTQTGRSESDGSEISMGSD